MKEKLLDLIGASEFPLVLGNILYIHTYTHTQYYLSKIKKKKKTTIENTSVPKASFKE